jgi:plasmid stabilization system protein ParE
MTLEIGRPGGTNRYSTFTSSRIVRRSRLRVLATHGAPNTSGLLACDTLRRKFHRQSHWIVYRRLPSDSDTLEIIAIAHERRGEEYWEQRFHG